MKKTLLLLLLSTQLYATELQLLGKSRLTWFGFKVYDAKLFAEKKSESLDQILHLELTYLRSLNGEAIFDRTIDEWEDLGISADKIKKYRPLIKGKFPDVNDGDTIRAEFDPNKGLKVLFNKDKVLINSTDTVFARDFISIWLAPNTSEKEMRESLFGLKDS